ncbi:MAG: thioredoxin domain-containing protein [Sedimentisphaerales bacterium]|nr:thioredoxin domain-containing protein [Sedimentisphaerales bacterium]
MTGRAIKIIMFCILLAAAISAAAISGCAEKNGFSSGAHSSGQITTEQSEQAIPDKISSQKDESAVKIIIYTDFECGACERFNLNIEPKLREFEAAGIVKIEMRVVGAISEDSSRAAQAALWANQKGRFLEYHDALFRVWRQNEEEPYSQKNLIKLAKSLHMDEKALKQSLEKQSMKAELENNMSMAAKDLIHMLPAVFINRIKIEGFKPLENYINAINRSLEKKPG